MRERCTKAKAGRILTIRPHHDLQAAARHQAATDPDWQADYRRWRPPVERAVAWLVQHGNRRLRYRGTIANNTWLHTRAAALNLRRLISLGLTRTNNTWHLQPGHPLATKAARPAAGRPLTKIFMSLLGVTDPDNRACGRPAPSPYIAGTDQPAGCGGGVKWWPQKAPSVIS
ncbi:transposase [Streptomyces sp. NPDC002577]